MKFSVLIFLYSSWFLMICLYCDYFIMALPGILILGKLSPQTSRYWVPINIGNHMPQSFVDLLGPDSQISSPDTNTAGETLSYSYPSLSWRLPWMFLQFSCVQVSLLCCLWARASQPDCLSYRLRIPLGQFILKGVRFFNCFTTHASDILRPAHQINENVLILEIVLLFFLNVSIFNIHLD